MLLWLGVDFPKTHDIGATLRTVLGERRIDVEQDFASWIEAFSADLARKRAPSFYCEQDFEEHDARSAIEGAVRMLAWADALIGPERAMEPDPLSK